MEGLIIWLVVGIPFIAMLCIGAAGRGVGGGGSHPAPPGMRDFD